MIKSACVCFFCQRLHRPWHAIRGSRREQQERGREGSGISDRRRLLQEGFRGQGELLLNYCAIFVVVAAIFLPIFRHLPPSRIAIEEHGRPGVGRLRGKHGRGAAGGRRERRSGGIFEAVCFCLCCLFFALTNLSEYLKSVKSTFGAEAFRHPFKKKPQVAAGIINQMVEEATRGKIKDLMPDGTT